MIKLLYIRKLFKHFTRDKLVLVSVIFFIVATFLTTTEKSIFEETSLFERFHNWFLNRKKQLT